MVIARRLQSGLAGVLVLGGCAHVKTVQDPKAARVCVDTRDIISINSLDDQHVFVRARVSHNFLFTVEKTCVGLRFARSVALEGALSRVCGNAADLMTFDAPGTGPTRCRLEQIDPVADRDEALDMIEARAPRE